jgi:hypothetical protein
MYLDYMIVIGRTFQEHLLRLGKVFQQFLEVRLELNPEKEVRYLGHIVFPERMTTGPEKLRVIREWATPKKK